MSVDSIKHKNEKRPLIPSVEEEGYEKANPKVSDRDVKEYPINPVVNRGQDPELFWLNKYGSHDQLNRLTVDIRSLYRSEHISPEVLIKKLYNVKELDDQQFALAELFGNGLDMDELEKVSEYYTHQEGWTNRMILGDSQLVMNSLLEREGFAGKVQMIYFDPPYGIKYGSNWQMKLNNRDVKDGNDEHLTGEPEQIKAYRDTWELGIHSYLSYLRDRLIIAKDLLTPSGSIFIQISDDNVHLVRSILDEIFGSENFCSQITFTKSTGLKTNGLPSRCDFILWYSKDMENVKYHQLFEEKTLGEVGATQYDWIHKVSGEKRRVKSSDQVEKGDRLFHIGDASAMSNNVGKVSPLLIEGIEIYPPKGRLWQSNIEGMNKLYKKGRLMLVGNSLRYIRYFDDFPVFPLDSLWTDTGTSGFGESKKYIVQTLPKAVQRCILMTTDPGDLVLDPTCGSGTSAYVAEQWGRRWITIDTSRIALNIAKTRLTTSVFPYYKLYDEHGKDIRQGFHYKKVPHITLKSLVNDEPAEEETLFDQPLEDKKKLRVSGPFTVETLQNLNPVSPEDLDKYKGEDQNFEERIFTHLQSAGVKTGVKEENAVFTRVVRLGSLYLHAEGFYNTDNGEKKAYIHIGPKYGTVSKSTVNEAIKECRAKGDVDWLIILGFSFESEIQSQNVTASMGSFRVSKVRMHDDLMQDGLLKKDKKAGSFITIAEPDIVIHKHKGNFQVEIQGLDIYDPITDSVKPRDVHDIAYWMIDDDYDGSNFIVKQIFFCGGDKDEFAKWKKGLTNIASSGTKKNLEKTLKIEIDDDAFGRVYGHLSHPIESKNKNHKIAVKVITQFGEESMKVIELQSRRN